MSERKRKQLVDQATRAHCDLNMFYAIIALAEGSLISADHETSLQRIVTICKQEGQRALHRYDKACADLLKDPRP